MKPVKYIGCSDFPCFDVNKSVYLRPAVDIQPEKVKVVMISEALPENQEDYFYAVGEPFYLKTTLQAFNDAGISVSTVLHQLDQKIIYPHYDFKHLTEKYFEIGMKLDDFLIQLVKYCSSMQDILDLGFYLTTAVKCSKTQYGVSAATIKNCSHILEKELALFPNLKVYLLMGDIAIKAFNYISKRKIGKNTIPAGSTYKIRKNQCNYSASPKPVG